MRNERRPIRLQNGERQRRTRTGWLGGGQREDLPSRSVKRERGRRGTRQRETLRALIGVSVVVAAEVSVAVKAPHAVAGGVIRTV